MSYEDSSTALPETEKKNLKSQYPAYSLDKVTVHKSHYTLLRVFFCTNKNSEKSV
jgi:hypothetical protein